MKAVLVQTPGGLEALQYTEVPDPTPQPQWWCLRCIVDVCYHDVVVRNVLALRWRDAACVLGSGR